MARSTIGGITGSNISGMGWVPRAQPTGGAPDYSQIARFFGGAVRDASGQIAKSIAGQQIPDFSVDSSAFYSPAAPFSFTGPAGNFPKFSGARQGSAIFGTSQGGYSI
jgi:hypothetical protein